MQIEIAPLYADEVIELFEGISTVDQLRAACACLNLRAFTSDEVSQIAQAKRRALARLRGDRQLHSPLG